MRKRKKHPTLTRTKIHSRLSKIMININNETIEKLKNLLIIMDYKQEKSYIKFIEEDKVDLLLNNQGVFNIYLKEFMLPPTVINWTKYIGILSGFHLYLFQHPDDKNASKSIFCKGANIVIDSHQQYLNCIQVSKKILYLVFLILSIDS